MGKKNLSRFFWFSISTACLLVLIWQGLLQYAQKTLHINTQQQSILNVKSGNSLTAIAQQLEKSHIITNARLLKLLFRLKHSGKSIKAGHYTLTSKMTYDDLLIKLIKGDIHQYQVTLVEGKTIQDTLKHLNQQEELSQPLSSEQFQELLKDLGIKGNPEGLFYPDTYFFSAQDTVKSLLIRAHKRLKRILQEQWQQRQNDLPYKSAYEALIMASLIEKETSVSYERPAIAGVFIRRLKKHMKLATDPSVIYGLKKRFSGNLTRRSLRINTPYNTYRNKGLPPTPIALTGVEAIHAALHPEAGRSLYFVAKGDGSHYFSETLSEHNKAVREFQIENRIEDYRSTPETENDE